jgi:hypothetical protein
MLTTLIILGVLGVVAGLAGRYRHASAFSAQKDQAIQAAQVTLQLVSNEARAAFLISAPTHGQPASPTLELKRVDPGADRLPIDPDPLPVAWDPYADETSVQVRYLLSGERLLRESTQASQTTSTRAGEGIAAFSAEFLPNRNLQLRLAMVSDSRGMVLKTEVFRGDRDAP